MSLPILASVLLLTGPQTSPDPAPVAASTPIATPIAVDRDSAALAQTTPQPSPTLPPTPTPPPILLPAPVPADAQAAPSATEQGDIVISARPRSAGDPLAGINAASFAATQAVDKAVVAPVSFTFKRIVPTPIRNGISNFVYNLDEIDVFLNFMLQHKIGKAVETAGRFVINSTLGVFGLFDIAKRRPFHLPRRPNGFSDTLGFYGVGPGPYIFLPIIGATTVRDFIGGNLDRLVVPLTIGKPFTQSYYTISTNIAITLDTRSQFDVKLQEFRESGDPYTARRDYYLSSRQAEIDHLRGTDKATPNPTAPTPTAPTAPAPTAPSPVKQ